MRLESLTLENFRSYISCELQFHVENDLTIFIGENAQGKTNLLESIALLALPRSFRTRSHRDLVHFEKEYYRVRGTLRSGKSHEKSMSAKIDNLHQNASKEYEIFFQKKPKVEKTLKSDGTFVPLREYVGQVHAVLFSPETMNLLSFGPIERRKFLNMLLCQMNGNYLDDLLQYQKALKSRNILLKRMHEANVQMNELKFWDSLLSDKGSSIILKRLECARNLASRLSEMYQIISGSSARLAMSYSNQFWNMWSEEYKTADVSADISCDEAYKSTNGATVSKNEIVEYYRVQLEKRFHRDRALKKTTFGPHQDDLHFYLDEKPLETIGSRGECRTAILALKMAELKYIERMTGEKPLFLLDDVFSELDRERQKRLLENIQSYQTIVTATHFPKEMRKEGKIKAFRIENSTIYGL